MISRSHHDDLVNKVAFESFNCDRNGEASLSGSGGCGDLEVFAVVIPKGLSGLFLPAPQTSSHA